MNVQPAHARFTEKASALMRQLPAGPSMVVIGSTSYWHGESPSTCAAIGARLAAIRNLILITGGMTGVGEGVGRSFFEARKKESWDPNVIHLLPRGSKRWDYGLTLFAGSDLAERREILARVSRLYLAIEGGPGTVHEGQVALSRGAFVVPVGRSGGYAGDLYPITRRPPFAPMESWNVLGSLNAEPEQVADAVYDILSSYLGKTV